MTESPQQETERRFITKYPNRRLYDRTLGHYFKLDDARILIQTHVEVRHGLGANRTDLRTLTE